MKKYAIIGSGGFIAQRHKQAIQDTGGEVVLTCDIDPTPKTDFTDYREMFSSPWMDEVDAISICTPNYLHVEMVRDALRTGKKVLCEKPLCINTDFTGMKGVNVVYQLHFHPLFNEVQEKLKKASKIKVFWKAYRDDEFWKSWKGDESKSGGVAYVFGAHVIDLLISALGKKSFIIGVKDDVRKSEGLIDIGDKLIEYSFEFLDSTNGQARFFEIDGKKYVFSTQDNLAFENLHSKVYENLWNKKVSQLEDIIPSIQLIDKIKKYKNL